MLDYVPDQKGMRTCHAPCAFTCRILVIYQPHKSYQSNACISRIDNLRVVLDVSNGLLQKENTGRPEDVNALPDNFGGIEYFV